MVELFINNITNSLGGGGKRSKIAKRSSCAKVETVKKVVKCGLVGRVRNFVGN